MEEVNLNPRRNRFGFVWLLGIVVFLTLAIWVFNTSDKNLTYTDNSTSGIRSGSGTSGGAANNNNWNKLDLNAPRVPHPDITISSSNFETRGNDKYTIYSLGENLLFEPNNAQLNSQADLNLIQIVNSINKKYENGLVRIYGYMNTKGINDYDSELASDRAMVVKDWLVSKGNIDESRISVESSKNSSSDRQRVEIVAINP